MENIKEKIGYLLNTSARLLRWEFNNQLKDYGLTTTQWAVIKDLHEQSLHSNNPDSTTPAAIANRLKLDRPTISGVIDRLVEQQFISRKPHPSDRRSQTIHLPEKTDELVDELDNLSTDVLSKALANFNEAEISQLKNSLTRIIKNLSSEGD